MKTMHAGERSELLQSLAERKFDLLVVGGGITGAGILRDAALRGLDCALLEAADFASGTSSKSTKLIHGGIRYLAMGHVHVVREAAIERKRVHLIAPHLAEPKWLTLPSRNRFEWLKYKIGVLVYEYLGQVARKDRHFDVSGARLAEHEPLLQRQRYPYACVYREYLTDDARLVLANIRAGVRHGALAANRLRVVDLVKDGGVVTGVRARCELTGEELVIRARVVINAAGPWVESITRQDGAPAPKSLVLSKGVHIVLSRDRVPLEQMILTVARDGRPVFLIPRGDGVYVGTTDSRYEGDATEWPEVTDDEIDYLLQSVDDYLGIRATRADVLSTWAGLRPLIAQAGKSTKEISRRDEIWVSESGLVTIAGGKLTGYRKMAEDTVDKALTRLGPDAPGHAGDERLPGGDFDGDLSTLVMSVTQNYPMPDAEALRLVRLYGTEAMAVLALGSERLTEACPLRSGEVRWAVREESAVNLEDLLYRRTRLVYYWPSGVREVIRPAAQVMATELGWSEGHTDEKIAEISSRLSHDLLTEALAPLQE